MTEGTRECILHLIHRHKKSNAADLAAELALATPTIRRHLDILQRDDLVDFEIIRQERGRPQYVYYLTERGQEYLPRAYPRLTIDILREIAQLRRSDLVELDGERLLSLIFEKMAQRLVDTNTQRVGEVDDLIARVEQTTNILKEMGFYAEYEVQDDNLLIRCYNCPYNRVAVTYPRLCELDLRFIQGLLKMPVEQMQASSKGASGCVYVVRRNVEILQK